MADTNNVFISWSGPRSNHVAKFLRKWLRNVIHSARPWMSEKDIKSGNVSVNSIRTALASAKVGIVCLTPENLKEPWLNFEVGGLSRTPEAETRVCTYLLAGLEPGQLEYPLAMFQARVADREQTLALVQDINKYLDENPLTEAEMKEAFEKWWPDLEKELNALPAPSIAPPPRRTTDNMVAEILELTRSIVPAVREISEQAVRSRSAKFLADAMAEANRISRFALEPLPQREYTTEPPAQPIAMGIPGGLGAAFGTVTGEGGGAGASSARTVTATGEGGAGASSARSSLRPEAPSPDGSSGPAKHRPLPSRSGGSSKK